MTINNAINNQLGTPLSGILTNCTGLPVSTGVSGLGSNVATFLGTPSSANLLAALTDETGTGSTVFGTSPTITTPTINQANLVGTTTNDNAAAGSVGELISSVVAAGSAISLTTATPANITSISLTAGDWDVWGNVNFSWNITAANVNMFGWSSTTSATLPDRSLYNSETIIVGGAGNSVDGFSIPSIRYSLPGTTTIYLSCEATFNNTCNACGGIYARRRR